MMVELIWKLDYPISIILAFFVFFIPLSKKKHYLPILLGGLVLIIGFALLRMIDVLESNTVYNIAFYFIVFLLLFLILFFTVDNIEISGLFFILACIISLQHICYKIVVSIFVLIDPNLLSSTEVYIPTFLCVSLVGDVIAYFCFSRKIDTNVLNTNNIYAILGVLLLMICTVIVNYFAYDIFFLDIPNIKLISFLINLSAIITTIIIIMFLYMTSLSINRKKENALVQLIADKDRERYELLKMTIEDINIKYHDLQHALTNNALDEELRKEIKESTTNYKAIINTSNRGLNVVIYESQLKCISKGIDLHILIDGDPLPFMKSHHTYALLSNLLDNALEAVEKIDDKDKKIIMLKIYKKNDNVIINIVNFMGEPVKFVNNYPVTSKKDKSAHGYGIKSAEGIVNRYNGNISIKNENDQFIINIVIPAMK